jgi:hypothetical protein
MEMIPRVLRAVRARALLIVVSAAALVTVKLVALDRLSQPGRRFHDR